MLDCPQFRYLTYRLPASGPIQSGRILFSRLQGYGGLGYFQVYESESATMVRNHKREKPRMGRPPRSDDPQRVLIVLPGELRRWLTEQASREDRYQSVLVEDALRSYRERAARRRVR